MDYRHWTDAQLKAELMFTRHRIHECRARGWAATATTYTSELATIKRELERRKLRV